MSGDRDSECCGGKRRDRDSECCGEDIELVGEKQAKEKQSEMYTIDETGIIRFGDKYKFLFGLLYHWTPSLYTVGPVDTKPHERIIKSVVMRGQGFFNNPFVRLGLGNHHIIRLVSSAETTIIVCHLNYLTGMMSPVLDTSNDLVAFNTKAGETRLFVLGNTSSVCVYSHNLTELKIEIESNPHPIDKFVGRLYMRDGDGEKRLIYTTVDVGGAKSGKIDVISPEFSPICELIHQSLETLSLPPPLLPILMCAGCSSTCAMVYQGGYLWSDFKGCASSWALDISTAAIKGIDVTVEYTSDGSKLKGTLILRHKIGPNTFRDVSADKNYIQCDDVSRVSVRGIALSQLYDNITVVIKLGDTTSFNVLPSSRCAVTL